MNATLTWRFCKSCGDYQVLFYLNGLYLCNRYITDGGSLYEKNFFLVSGRTDFILVSEYYDEIVEDYKKYRVKEIL